MPLSYTTVRSDVFGKLQVNNDGCTDDDGQRTINCGVESTLLNCNRGPVDDLNYSDLSKLSNYFIWNRTSSIVRNVSIIFRFNQQINVRRIVMFVWNSPVNSILVPNMSLFWSNDNSNTPYNEVNFTNASGAPTEDRRYRINLDISNEILVVHSLRMMLALSNGAHIFLSEMFICGKCIMTVCNK